MEFGQIEAFVEVARHGSISRAAESLYLTQPTVTERLRALEARIGQRLFTRIRYGVVLTDAGKTLLPYADRVLKTIGEAEMALQNLAEATEGFLYLGSAKVMSTYLLPQLLEEFSARHPGVHVSVRTARSEDVLEMVLRGEAQIGLVRNMKHPEIETMTLQEDELILVAHPSHPFAQRASVTLREVAEEGIVAFDHTMSDFKLINAIFINAGLALKARFEMDSVEAAKKMVEKGLGISLLPGFALQKEIALGTVRAVEIADVPPLRREWAAVYRRESGLGGIARAFLAVAETASRVVKVPLPR